MAAILTICVAFILLNAFTSAENNTDEFTGKRHTSPAIIPEQQILTLSGLPVNISCYSPNQSPLKSCRWERKLSLNGKRYTLCVNETEIYPATENDANCNCSYKYAGNGLDKGDCSISIFNASDFHFAQWECTLVGLDDHVWIGTLNISHIASKPYYQPTNISNGIFFNETMPTSTDVTCCVDFKEPKLSVEIKMEWENRDALSETLSQSFGTSRVYSTRENQTCLRTNHIFTYKDNGKNLLCISTHTYRLHEYRQQAVLPVNVTFAPLFSSENLPLTTQLLTENNSLLISVPFLANPKPTISWYLKNNPSTGASFEIHKNHMKYKTSLHHHQGSNYTTTVEILNLNSEDYRDEFLVHLLNAYGSKQIPVTLDNPNNGKDSRVDKYWITILIAIATVIFIVLLASIIFIVVRHRVKARGKYVPTQVSYTTDGDIFQIS